MKLKDWIDEDRLKQLIEDKLVSDRKHPEYPLHILNYTPAAAGEKVWDKTLSRCRGLVYEEDTNDIYAIPFAKFWNYGDPRAGELPTEVPEIYEKLDGSLGIGFFYQEKFIIATRGSFESDQAKWANEWAKRFSYPDTNFSHNYTYLFEIVCPEDRKVVKYDFSGLVLLGSIGRFSGYEHPPDGTFEMEKHWMKDVRVARRYDYEDLEKLQAKNFDNQEGYVSVWYGNPFEGRKTFRVKLKFETYCLLHRMYFQTTPAVIWEWLKEGRNVGDALNGADANLLNWALGISLGITTEHENLKLTSSKEFRECVLSVNYQYDLEAPEKERRKAFALEASKSKTPSLLFLLYDAKFALYEEQLWKLVKPKNSRTWKTEEEDT